MGSILVGEGEQQDIADKLAESTVSVLASGALGPRPFLVASPSGADYGFFVQQKSSDCLLRLFRRQKGGTRYSNNLTYIAMRRLDESQCAEECLDGWESYGLGVRGISRTVPAHSATIGSRCSMVMPA